MTGGWETKKKRVIIKPTSKAKRKKKKKRENKRRNGWPVIESTRTRPLRLIRLRAVSPASRLIASRDITSRPISLMATSTNHHARMFPSLFVCFFSPLYFFNSSLHLCFVFFGSQSRNELAWTGRAQQHLLNALFHHCCCLFFVLLLVFLSIRTYYCYLSYTSAYTNLHLLGEFIIDWPVVPAMSQ